MRAVIAVVSIASIAALACSDRHRTPDSGSRPSPLSTAVSLDSCEQLDAQGRAQSRVFAPGESLPGPHVGSWAATTAVAIDGMRLDVPVGVELNPPNPENVHALWEFPSCRFACSLSVFVTPDSTHGGLDGYLARLRTISPTKSGDEPLDTPGPPRFLTIDSERAAYMDTPCGDCTSALIVTVHAGRVIHFNLSLDDQEGYQPGLMCRLARVAASARWVTDHHQ